jgi:hypothetical protein
MDVLIGTPGPRHARPGRASSSVGPAARAAAVLVVAVTLTAGVLVGMASILGRWS